MTTPNIGDTVPGFEAPSTQGEINSNDWRNRFTVLFFYPRNNTPGCTTESKDFASLYQQFKDLNSEVFGISRDTLKSHENVTKKLSLPYALIADPEETICNLFGVMKQKSMFGKQVKGIERSTFVFDKDGILIKEWRKIKVPGHAQEVLSYIKDN